MVRYAWHDFNFTDKRTKKSPEWFVMFLCNCGIVNHLFKIVILADLNQLFALLTVASFTFD